MASQGLRGGRSFGDISQGRRESYLDAERCEADRILTLRRTNLHFPTCRRNATESYKLAAKWGSLAHRRKVSPLAALTTRLVFHPACLVQVKGFTDVGRQTAQDKIDAGEMIRPPPSGTINDQIAGNILGASNHAPQQLKTVQDLLRMINLALTTSRSRHQHAVADWWIGSV